ncbi:MAG: thiolase, partial [Hyphomicrobium sp.]|nr:thiolase [Hyphomicrobium sp.]
AIVMTRADRVPDLRNKAVRVLGYAESYSHQFTPFSMPDWLEYGIRADTDRALGMAGITRSDIDVVQIYDHFTIGVLLALEELGFCERGQGGAFATPERIGPGGDFPVNTSGGGLSYCHPGMFGMLLLVEAVRQLRGQCGDRQVPGASVALCQAPGLIFSGNMTCILGRD